MGYQIHRCVPLYSFHSGGKSAENLYVKGWKYCPDNLNCKYLALPSFVPILLEEVIGPCTCWPSFLACPCICLPMRLHAQSGWSFLPPQTIWPGEKRSFLTALTHALNPNPLTNWPIRWRLFLDYGEGGFSLFLMYWIDRVSLAWVRHFFHVSPAS